MVDLPPDVGVLGEGGVEVDHDTVQPVLQQHDLLAQVLLLLTSLFTTERKKQVTKKPVRGKNTVK